MAVTILERPEGHILNPTEIGGNITEYLPGSYALVTNPLGFHGLTTGDTVYIQSDVDAYNGFFTIEVTTVQSFLLIDSPYVSYISTLDMVYYVSTLTHGVSAVHLPITYKLSNNLYPTNSVDTTRNINSVQDANGFTVLQLSGSLGDVQTYDFVKLTLPSDSDLDGVYQIVEWISSTVVIVNIPYSSSNNFTGATALKYYNNYNIVVRVYAGINASHTWALQKPYEIAATLELIPDSNNEVFFSINELLKSYIETRNNLLLGTLPNNIDFWNNFYIETAESYDDSDGYVFGTYTSGFTSDQSSFEGMAVNADLEFKNINSGSMSDYIAINSASKFLTLFDTPVLFTGAYQDISWLKHDNLPIIIKKEYSLNGDIGTTITETFTDSGVIRTEIEADCNYDTLSITGVVENSISSPSVNRNTAGVTNLDHTISIPANYSPIGTYTYLVQLAPTVSAADSAIARLIYFYADGTNEIVFTIAQTTLGSSSASNVVLPTPSKSVILIRLQAEIIDAPPTTVNGSVLLSVTFEADLASLTLTETKDFSIDCNCSPQELTLTWLNNLGGFDYWNFTAKKDHLVEIREAIETKKNILPQWPKSYGSDADTIRRQTSRTSNKAYTVRSQHLTEAQVDAISYLKSSVLVQIINSRHDRRTVIVDADSFVKYQDQAKEWSIAFNISFTDDIPSQTV